MEVEGFHLGPLEIKLFRSKLVIFGGTDLYRLFSPVEVVVLISPAAVKGAEQTHGLGVWLSIHRSAIQVGW